MVILNLENEAQNLQNQKSQVQRRSSLLKRDFVNSEKKRIEKLFQLSIYNQIIQNKMKEH